MAGNNFLDKFKNNIDNSLLSASKLKPGELKSQTPAHLNGFTFPTVKKTNAFTIEKSQLKAKEKPESPKVSPSQPVEDLSEATPVKVPSLIEAPSSSLTTTLIDSAPLEPSLPSVGAIIGKVNHVESVESVKPVVASIIDVNVEQEKSALPVAQDLMAATQARGVEAQEIIEQTTAEPPPSDIKSSILTVKEEEAAQELSEWIQIENKTPEEIKAELQLYQEAVRRQKNLEEGLVEVYDISSRKNSYIVSKEEVFYIEPEVEPQPEVKVEVNLVKEEKSWPEKTLPTQPLTVEPQEKILPIQKALIEHKKSTFLSAEEIKKRKDDRHQMGVRGPENFFLDEVKTPEVLDIFEKIKSEQQNKLNTIIRKEKSISMFRAMCYASANHILLTIEALEKDTYIHQTQKKQKSKVKITAAHLKQVGLDLSALETWEDEDFEAFDEEDFAPDVIAKLHERNSSMGNISQDFSYLNPIGTKIAQKRQEFDYQDKKKSREEKITKHRKTLDIYSDNESSIYQKAIAQFLSENDDILRDSSNHEKLPHLREKDEFEEFLEELDDD